MEFTIENVCGFLIRSRLMSADEMKVMYQRWLDAKVPDATLADFTKWMVANQYVTEYQGSLLAKGHGEPEVFFLGQYKILDRLGRGRMAGVYKAVHSLGQTVAIKVLPPSQAKNPQMLGRFEREARLALKLKHPNVVRSFQVGETNGLHYLVMEYLDGETLEDVLQRRQKLEPNEAVRIIHQALLGLQHIHEQGMVHRDLKPANLMLLHGPEKLDQDTTLQAHVKILDIGLGRELFEEKPGPATGNRLELTAEGVLLGTPDYLAPEQARDPRNIDIRADIYSLGCVLYHALTGQPPFPDKNVLSQMVRHATEAPRPLQEFNPAIPDGLQQIMNWMLAKQPAERYPTPERAAQALQVFLLADSAPARVVEEPLQMRKYLTWLEASAPGDPPLTPREAPASVASAPTIPPPPAPQVVSPPPAAPERPNAPVAAPVAGTAPKPRPTVADRSRQPQLKKLRRNPRGEPRAINIPQAKPYAAPPESAKLNPDEFDVELVPLPTPAAREPNLASTEDEAVEKVLGLTYREWLLVGVGAGVVLALVGLVVVIALVVAA